MFVLSKFIVDVVDILGVRSRFCHTEEKEVVGGHMKNAFSITTWVKKADLSQ